MYDTSPVITRGSPKNTRRERKFSILYRRAEAAVRVLYLMHCCMPQRLLVDCGTHLTILCPRAALWRHQRFGTLA